MIALWQQLLIERKKRYILTGITLVFIACVALFQFQKSDFDPLHYGLDPATYPIYILIPVVYFLVYENEEIFKAWGKARLRLLPMTNLRFLLGNVLFGLFTFLGWSILTYFLWYGAGMISGFISLPSFTTLLYVFVMAIDFFLGVTMMIQSIGLVSKSMADFWPRRGKKAVRIFIILLLFVALMILTSFLPGMPNIYGETTEFGFDVGITMLTVNDGLILFYDSLQILVMSVATYYCMEKFYEGS